MGRNSHRRRFHKLSQGENPLMVLPDLSDLCGSLRSPKPEPTSTSVTSIDKIPDLGDLTSPVPEPTPQILTSTSADKMPDLGDLTSFVPDPIPPIAPGTYIPSVKNSPDMGEEDAAVWCIVEHKLENGIHKYGIKSIEQAPPDTRASSAMTYKEALVNLGRMNAIAIDMDS